MSQVTLLERVLAGHEVGPVQRAMREWDGRMTPEALRRVHELELVDAEGDRSSGEGRFRGSLLGNCLRMQMLSHVGYLGDPPDPEGLAMMNDGTQRHYWWQKVGLSAGFLDEIERKAWYEPYHFGGQLDGCGTDHQGRRYGFELKSTNPTKFAKGKEDYGVTQEEYTQVQKSGKVLTKHACQIGGYFQACPDLDYFSVVYEARSYKVEWFEVVVRRSDVEAVTEKMFTDLLTWRDREQLPPMLEGYPNDNQCKYWCAYSRICPSAEF